MLMHHWHPADAKRNDIAINVRLSRRGYCCRCPSRQARMKLHSPVERRQQR